MKSILAWRIVDLYFPNGKKYRDVYRFVQQIDNGRRRSLGFGAAYQCYRNIITVIVRGLMFEIKDRLEFAGHFVNRVYDLPAKFPQGEAPSQWTQPKSHIGICRPAPISIVLSAMHVLATFEILFHSRSYPADRSIWKQTGSMRNKLRMPPPPRSTSRREASRQPAAP